MPSSRLAPAGAHAASGTGIVSDMPNARTTSLNRNSTKPVITPPATMNMVPPRRVWRSEKAAAKSTIAQNSSGVDSSDWK